MLCRVVKGILKLSVSSKERDRLEILAKDTKIDELTKKNKRIDSLEVQLKELTQSKEVNPDEATTELIMTILKNKKIIK